MHENKLFETLLDVIPFPAYAVDIETYEVVYANKIMAEKMFAPREEFCWKKVFGQDEVCSWCTISSLKQRERVYRNEKLVGSFFDEATDRWFQSYDELVSWPDGRSVKYSIAVDITEQKEIQASMIQTHTKLAIQTKKLKDANDKLEFMAKKDYLTKIDNRRNFFYLGEELYATSLNTNDDEIYVAMFDLDKFKNLNDKYGHQVGDKALISFTQEVQKYLDANDIFGRLGGEEFAMIIKSCSNNAIAKVEKIREAVSKIVIYGEDKEEIYFTVSIGMVKKEADETLDATLEKADKLLYEAKDSGRNQLKFRIKQI